MEPIPGFSEYFADELGNIYSHISGCPRLMKPSETNEGYLRLRLYEKGECHFRSVHRIILETFIGECPNGMEACHNDGNKMNNNIGNLRWDTHRNNILDKKKHGTDKKKHGTMNVGGNRLHGESVPNAKLNELQVRISRRFHKLYGHGSQKYLSILFSVDPSTIHKIIHRYRWEHI
jgi:hypothetical protein